MAKCFTNATCYEQQVGAALGGWFTQQRVTIQWRHNSSCARQQTSAAVDTLLNAARQEGEGGQGRMEERDTSSRQHLSFTLFPP